MQLYSLQNIFLYRADMFNLSIMDGLLLMGALLFLLGVVILYQQVLPVLYLAQEEVDVLNEQERRIRAREYLIRLTEEQSRIQQEVEKKILDDIAEFDRLQAINDVD